MYKIAGLNIAISGGGDLLSQRAAAYSTECADAVDMEIEVPAYQLLKMQQSFPHLTKDECAYIFAGEEFHYDLIHFACFRLHASAVVLDGRAYLFSAPSGTGKSTHTSLWCDYFGRERTYILNDDMPAIRQEGNRFTAYGTPWSGTSPLNQNAGVPLQAIAFMERSQTDWIRPASHNESIIGLMSHSINMSDQTSLEKLLALLEALLKAVPIYRMGCTISHHSVKMAHAAMNI